MFPFERVLIVGLGLIGGSWALALRRAGFDGEIVAYDTDPAAAVAAGSTDLKITVETRHWRGHDARAGDLVVLATPVGATVDLLRGPVRDVAAGVVVTDVGSTKRAVGDAWDELPPLAGVDFVGGHPMAGSQHSGFGAARADLFDGATYFLVAADGNARNDLVTVVGALGAHPVVVEATTHDRAVALSSHLPQLVSSALGAVVAESGQPVVRAPGLSSMTRLAASPWSVWRDTMLSNRDEIAVPLDELIRVLEEARQALAAGDAEPLARLFARAESFEESPPLPVHPLHGKGT